MSEKYEKRTVRMPLSQLKVEEGADELLSSPNMKLYVRFWDAVLGKEGAPELAKQALEAITALPLEQRYVWRIVSALNWAFGGFDAESIKLDMRTLSAEDLSKVRDLALTGDWAAPAAASEPTTMPVRPYQFCRYLAALFGPEIMEEMIASAVVMAKANSTEAQTSRLG